MFALLAVAAVFGASIAGDCAELAILQCRTCLRSSAHGFPASKGILGVDEELHVLELNGLVSHVEKVLDLLHREP